MMRLASLACFSLVLASAMEQPLMDIDRDFDHASVQLRLARGQAERLSGRAGPKTALDPKAAVEALRAEVHSLRKEFDAADSIGKDVSPQELEAKLNSVFNSREAPEPREPRRPRTMKHAAKSNKTKPNKRWTLAFAARTHPWFKNKQAQRCDKKATTKKSKSHSSQKALIQQDSFRGGGRRRVSQGDASSSVPGAGGTQVIADEGRSTTGSVNHEEPMDRIYKDGYSEVGCYTDSMVAFGDKFGDNKDQYRMQNSDVSVVWYAQHVLDENKQPMRPEVCYQFCRTVPHMVYFGIHTGVHCYCTPYFKPMASSEAKCDTVCMGDTTMMCGGTDKSSVFEMHFCNSAGEELKDAATGAAEVLSFFEEEAWALDQRAAALNAAGVELQKVAGNGGDPVSGDLAQLAKKAAGEWENTLKDGECFQAFNSLQGYYSSAEQTFSSDLMKSENAVKADDEVYELTTLSQKVHACAKKAEAQNLAAFPWHEKAQEAGSSGAAAFWSDHLSEAQLVSQLYYPLQYGLNPTTTITDEDVTMSTCSGEVIGAPMSLWFAECAAACEQTVFPQKCIGFQHYASAGGGDEFPPLCVLFREFDTLTEHKCPDATWPELLQAPKKTAKAPKQAPGDVNCADVKFAVLFSGQTCERAYGSSSKAGETCSDVCGEAKGFGVSAGCFVRLAELATGGMPDVDSKLNKRCFGSNSNGPKSAGSGPSADMPTPDFSTAIKFGSDEAKATTIWT